MNVVVDTNVLAYYWLPGRHTETAISLRRATDLWHVPKLWRSELRNVLAGFLRRGDLSLAQAQATMQAAEVELLDCEWEVSSMRVLDFVSRSDCSAYDCEFVALAAAMNIPLVTEDQRILRGFPDMAVPMAHLAQGRMQSPESPRPQNDHTS